MNQDIRAWNRVDILRIGPLSTWFSQNHCFDLAPTSRVDSQYNEYFSPELGSFSSEFEFARYIQKSARKMDTQIWVYFRKYFDHRQDPSSGQNYLYQESTREIGAKYSSNNFEKSPVWIQVVFKYCWIPLYSWKILTALIIFLIEKWTFINQRSE